MKNPHWSNRNRLLSKLCIASAGPRIAAVVISITALLLSAGITRAANQIPLSGTSSPQTGDSPPSGDTDVTHVEFFGQEDEEDGSPGPYPGIITNRSLSRGVGNGVSVNSGRKAKSNPQFRLGFEGLNFYQQRYSNRGNQFSVEPPDQGMCVGNGYVIEAVNDVLNIFSTSGQSVLPDNTATNIVSGFPRNVKHAVDLNSFFGYQAAINRTTGARGAGLTDPSCLYDAATQRFFVVVLTLDTLPNGTRTLVNHLDIAVSQTSNPTGSWNIYKIDVTNDGTNTGGVNAGPYLGDYPHIGADANGFYITTNAYPWLHNGFAGAQIYALSKAQLAAGAANVTLVHIDTSGGVNLPSDAGSTQPGFTVWPAQSPGANQFDLSNGGTEYFLSSNAADEATHPVAGTGGNYVSNQIIVWTLANTSSLNTATPALSLSTRVVPVGTYAIPPKQKQPGSGSLADKILTPLAPQGDAINDTTTPTIAGVGAWRLLFVGEPAHNEVISRPDSNDTRMQQVMFANGKLWGALDTALTLNTVNKAGIEWFIVKPSVSSAGVTGSVALQGYLGLANNNLTYPAIGVTTSGRGVMAFTVVGGDYYPSAGYAGIDASVGVGDIHIANAGLGPDDGFTSYKAFVGNPPRTRWGDYGAAVADGNSMWIASEYIGQTCTLAQYRTAPFGSCGGTRTSLGNWDTRISKVTP